MMWIKINTDLANDPRIDALALARDISRNEALGIVTALYCFTAKYFASGKILTTPQHLTEKFLARGIMCTSEDIYAMIDCGILVKVRYEFRVLDWQDTFGKAADDRERAKRNYERKKALKSTEISAEEKKEKREDIYKKERKNDDELEREFLSFKTAGEGSDFERVRGGGGVIDDLANDIARIFPRRAGRPHNVPAIRHELTRVGALAPGAAEQILEAARYYAALIAARAARPGYDPSFVERAQNWLKKWPEWSNGGQMRKATLYEVERA